MIFTVPIHEQAEEAAREFSSTQVDLLGKLRAGVLALAAQIPDRDLAADGREANPHVTVKYGLHTDSAADVAKVLQGEPPVLLKLGKTMLFEAPGEYDVVILSVDSADLRRINHKIAGALKVTDTHPVYKPHVTLAYVKPGRGKQYVGANPLTGQSTILRTLIFSGKDKSVTSIPLRGAP